MELAALISDFLSVITISLCLFAKVPQIKTIFSAKSARGINLCGLLMELASYSTTAVYNVVNGYALLSYMEYPILIVQEYLLVYLVLLYQNLLGKRTFIFTTVYFIIIFSFLLGAVPGSLITYLIPFCTPVSLSSKAIQLWEIIKTRNSDSVSVTTWAISAATNGSRIYTIYLDSADIMLLSNFGLSTIMSSAIAVAAYHFKTKMTKIQ